ncbi:hypothetical protein, partial [Streptomyces alkaliterrae]|uniref:hypothetical protein n=1 Tax=Streptomyces alkaliterrae TaxID=2213162 RepID=UPI001E50B5DC
MLSPEIPLWNAAIHMPGCTGGASCPGGSVVSAVGPTERPGGEEGAVDAALGPPGVGGAVTRVRR